MDPLVLSLTLVAAVLHASWNALVKTGSDALLRLTLVNSVSGLAALACLPFVALPDAASWPYLLGSVVLHQFYYLALIVAYRHGDLSAVYPMARGIAPLLIAAAAALFAGESLPPLGIAALLLISAAIFSLARNAGLIAHGRAHLSALAVGVAIAGYSVLDGFGGRNAGDVYGYIAVLFVLDAVPLAVFTLHRRRASLLVAVSAHWRGGVAGGLFSLIAYAVVIWAMTRAPMASVSAVRECSVIVAAFIGGFILREPMAYSRIAAAVVVAIGIGLLQLASYL